MKKLEEIKQKRDDILVQKHESNVEKSKRL